MANARRVLLLVLALMLLLSGCPRKPTPVPSIPPFKPIESGAVPTIRVLLTNRSISGERFSANGVLRLVIDGKTVARTDSQTSSLSVRRNAGQWCIAGRYHGGERIVATPDKGLVSFSGRQYRGNLYLIARSDDSFDVINYLDLESYLAGVLNRELYSDWHMESFRSLAVTARTFALYHCLETGGRGNYDVKAGVGAQVYGGYADETPKSRQAVAGTYGQVLMVEQGGQLRLFVPQYSSCCGGWVNSARVLRDVADLPVFQGGQRCQHCTASTKYRWATVRVSKQEIYRVLCERFSAARSLGGVRTIRVVEQLPYGRAVWVDVVGYNGKAMRLRAERLRLALLFERSPAGKKLYSMNCQIVDAGNAIEFRNGRGFGHGVGLCQYGTEGKAKEGWFAPQILAFYYPGSQICKAY